MQSILLHFSTSDFGLAFNYRVVKLVTSKHKTDCICGLSQRDHRVCPPMYTHIVSEIVEKLASALPYLCCYPSRFGIGPKAMI
jgi:hypothetical protein